MSRTFELQRVSARAGATPVSLTALANGETAHRWPSFLPDGEHFLYLSVRKPGDLGELRIGSLDGTPSTSLGPSESNALYSAGHLLSLSGDQLVARRFDESARNVTGVPFPVTTTPKLSAWNRLGAFSASHSGVLAYHPGGAIPIDQRLTWLDRTGRPVGTVGEIGRFSNVDLSPDGKRLAVATGRVGGNSDIWVIDLARGDAVPLASDPAWEFDPAGRATAMTLSSIPTEQVDSVCFHTRPTAAARTNRWCRPSSTL